MNSVKYFSWKKAGWILLLTCFFISTGTHVNAQKEQPQEVYSIVKELHPFDWYLTQAGLWQKKINSDSSDVKAWWNYYVANRMAGMTGSPEQLENTQALQKLPDIVQAMAKKIPDSFEYNLIAWWNAGNNAEFINYLWKAYELGPDRIEIQDDLITRYEITGEKEKKRKACQTWFNSGDLSQGIMELNYNTLLSLPEKAILFVNGDNDTYQKWILQDVLNVRPNVYVLNISLLFIEEYRNRIFKEIGLPEFTTKVNDLITKEDKESGNYQALFNRFQMAFIQHLIDNSPFPVYFSSFLQTQIIDAFQENLYIEGLAFKYSNENYDNLAVLRKNVEQNFHLDYLGQEVTYDPGSSVLVHSNRNYFLPFTKLYNHYRLSGEDYKARKIYSLLQNIARKAGMEEELLQDLDKE